MRQVVSYQLTSLDGIAEEPGDWMFDSGQAIFDNLARVIAEQDTILLGRRTYEYWADFWPHDGPEPFRSFINDTPKHVFTSKPLDGKWANTVVVNESAVEHVRELKKQPGRNIGIHGSIELFRSLLRADLVDELRLVVAATLAGNGQRLFDTADELRRLTLVGVDRSPVGTLLLGYRTDGAR